MFKKGYFIYSFLIFVLPGFSQNREVDILEYLSSNNKPKTETNSKSIEDVLGLIGGEAEFTNTKGQTSVQYGALDILATAGSSSSFINDVLSAVASNGSNTQKGKRDYSALDMITSAFAGNSFYNAGNWSDNHIQKTPNPFLHSNATGVYPAPNWGIITSGFGYRPRFKRMHKGIDIAMSVGDTVSVVLPGVVDRVNYEARGYGNYIVVKHDNGMETRYAHLSAPLVVAGQRVMENQPIALSGNTGNSTGPHLHFETRYFGVAVDPTTVFDFSGGYNKMRNARSIGDSNQQFKASNGNSGNRSTYVVKVGDTLKKIAERHGISVYRLCQLNFIMENEKLQPGTMLKLR